MFESPYLNGWHLDDHEREEPLTQNTQIKFNSTSFLKIFVDDRHLDDHEREESLTQNTQIKFNLTLFFKIQIKFESLGL